MKSMYASVLAFSLFSTIAVFAAPSNHGYSSEFSAVTQSPSNVLLGINCRGSVKCSAKACTVSIAELKQMVDKIEDTREYANGGQVACAKCPRCVANEPNCPFPRDMGICVFPQKMKIGEKISGRGVKSAVNALIMHGCGRCGSSPVHSGKDANKGEVTINYTTSACKRGVLCKVAEAYRHLATTSETSGSLVAGTATVVE